MATTPQIRSKIKEEATLISDTPKNMNMIRVSSRRRIDHLTGLSSEVEYKYDPSINSPKTSGCEESLPDHILTLCFSSSRNIEHKSKPRELADEMDEVREENGRLKLVLSNMMNDYKTLQQHIGDIDSTDHKQQETNKYSSKDGDKEDALVVLSLGRSSLLEAKNKDQLRKVHKKEDGNLNHKLALRLDGRSYEYSGDQIDSGVSKSQSLGKIEEESSNDHKWPTSTGLKASRSEDDENLLQNPAKKARVAVRAICNGPTMNDGCHWRKYGQKIAKGNPCPRAYYRCTMSPSCPVRKHVQRCQEDLSILVTTYEGAHDHTLSPSAKAMASTTSAAVSMLKSSSTSTSQPSLSFPSTTSANTNRPPFSVPNTTISTSQSHGSHPTITLDLTTPSASSHYNKYSSTLLPPHQTTYSPAACLNFSAPSSSTSYSSLYNYNNYNMPHKNTSVQTLQPQFSMEKIADATKEITSNPSFQSALAAAISSIVGKTGGGIAESMESPFATSYLNRTATVLPSIFPQARNLKFDFPPFGSSKGDFRK